MGEKIKHLEFIQNIVNRMARNSFLLKGWCITALFAFVVFAKDGNFSVLKISFMVIIGFFLLDVYYLYQERLFRNLYDKVRTKTNTDFSMKTSDLLREFLYSLLSPSVLFYLFLLIAVGIIN